MSGQPPQPTGTTSSKTSIRIGDDHYELDISKIPYLSGFVSFQKNSQPQTTEFVHGPIPLFAVALKGIQHGYRQCFRALPPDLSQHRALCETYDFLGLDLLARQSIRDIATDLTRGRSDYDREERCTIPGNKSAARDAAFRLLYLVLRGEFADEARDSAKVFNAVLFVVSHSGTFKWRTRKVVRAAYEERFVPSVKQRARLDQWEKGEDAMRAAEEREDATTEDEGFDYGFDSDFSD